MEFKMAKKINVKELMAYSALIPGLMAVCLVEGISRFFGNTEDTDPNSLYSPGLDLVGFLVAGTVSAAIDYKNGLYDQLNNNLMGQAEVQDSQ
jgi:hypothetical protein